MSWRPPRRGIELLPYSHPKIRDDLAYSPDPDTEGRQLVKDPIRREYHRFNDLQVVMMKALDGQTSAEDLYELLGEEFGVEVPPDKINAFIARLERSLLLDISSYEISDKRTRRAIARRLRKRKLVFRAKSRSQDNPVAQLFDNALEQATTGDPCRAADYLQAVLEIEPENLRARAVLTCIHEAYFYSRRAMPSYAKTFHLWNPDKFLGAVDRKIGRFVFTRTFAVLLGLFVLSIAIPAIHIFSNPALLPKDLTALDFVAFELLIIVMLLIHELGHGLACKHYGGSPDDIGVLLLFGVLPAAYCDVSDSYRFKSRRHKIIVLLSGVPAGMIPLVFAWYFAAAVAPDFPGRTGILLLLIFSLWDNLINFLPLVPLDGYFALADYLGITNLRKRSFDHVRNRLQVRLLGVPAEGPEPTPRERRIFLLFGVAAGLYTIFYIYVIWISFLLPLATKHLGDFGIVLTALYFTRLIVFTLFGRLITFGRFVVRHRAIIFTWRRLLVLSVAAAGTAAILSTPWPLYLDGRMTVEPQERVVVRASEPGLLVDFLVSEGALVKAGDTLAVFDSAESKRDREIASAELAVANSELRLLKLGATSEQVAVATAQTNAARVKTSMATERLRKVSEARELGVASDAELARAEGDAESLRGGARVASAEGAIVRSGTRAEELQVAEANERELQNRVARLDARLAQLVIRAPIDGVIVGKNLPARRGEWFSAGAPLLEIHSSSSFYARVEIDNRQPLGALATGQRVALRVVGHPHEEIFAEVTAVLPPDEVGKKSVIVRTSLVDGVRWRAGMTGHARVYGPNRSIAYRVIAIPFIQIFDYDLWRWLWG